MNILNQSITPSGQPVLPSKGPNSPQDVTQRFPISLPLHGSQSLKSFHPTSVLNKVLSTITTGESSHGAMNGISNLSELLGNTFQHSLVDNEEPSLMEDGGELDHNSRTNFALVVSVTSAVELESKQIDLISKKMRRLTGFRNLKVKNIIDPSLIAGFVICYGTDESHVIDLSVKGQLAVLAARVESSDKRIAGHGQSWSIPSSKS